MANHVGGTLEDVGGRGIACVIPTFYTRDIICEGKWADDMRNSEAVFRRTFPGCHPGEESLPRSGLDSFAEHPATG
jgi:hypothetical protein